MSEKELNEYLNELNAFKKEVTSSKEKSLDFLKSAGILDENGELSPQYAGE
ncbi:hypothetical protein [Paenibacillus whitsoniae]|uniref:hypothetical protein n=1 Tax=Paenibacillus whitsoniae TaxID=2496558 RepID=UPI0013DE9606|nr:hypothetical protein [Paenibacillus whitsoniae]